MPRQLANRTRAHPPPHEAFPAGPCGPAGASGITRAFARLSRGGGQVAHVLLTRSPLYSAPEGAFRVRLACVKRAASVHPEPGSNSPFERAAPRGRTLKCLRTEGRIRNLPPPFRRRSRVHRLGFILVVSVSGSQGSARPRPVPRPPVRGGRPPWRKERIYAPPPPESTGFPENIGNSLRTAPPGRPARGPAGPLGGVSAGRRAASPPRGGLPENLPWAGRRRRPPAAGPRRRA